MVVGVCVGVYLHWFYALFGSVGPFQTEFRSLLACTIFDVCI